MRYLKIDDIVSFAAQRVELYKVRDEKPLLYLIEAIDGYSFGEERYPGPFRKAALYAQQIILGNVFIDGNKRTGLASALKFLNKNGYHRDPRSDFDAKFTDLGFKIAEGVIKEVEEIAEYLKELFYEAEEPVQFGHIGDPPHEQHTLKFQMIGEENHDDVGESQ